MKFIISLLFLAALNGTHGDKASLRGHQTHRNLEININDWQKQCKGTTCGMWGDPHMVTCDNLSYDCQGIGIFTLMKNHMWNVQANFVDVGTREHEMVENWGLVMGASLTNDIALDYVYDDSVPIFQFGFGDLSARPGPAYGEKDCLQLQMFTPFDMPGTSRTVEEDVVACRERCVEKDGCIGFSYWADKGCHLTDGNQEMSAAPSNWARSVIGYLDNDCGKPTEIPQSPHQEERDNAGSIGNNCPLLMWADGQLVDLSEGNDQGYLYGQQGDKHYVFRDGKSISIVNELENGELAEALLIAKGDGPGQLWSCHWDFYICLPPSQEAQFRDYSVGLLGTPDGDTSNDWMDVDGNTITIQRNHVDSFNYCVENWCVSQEDSLMSFRDGFSFDHYRCEDEEFIDWEIHQEMCLVGPEKIEQECGGLPPLLLHSCQVDCCMGGCNSMAETVEEVTDITKFGENPNATVVYDYPDYSDCEKDGSFKDTSDTVCPNSGTPVVKLLKSHGDVPLPEGVDIFYGIVTDMEPHDGAFGPTVKFKVNNPFDSNADVYVKHEKSVLGGFNDIHCVEFDDIAGGCDDEAEDIEVACRHFDGVAPFALVNVYFASRGLTTDPSVDVDKCCHAPEYASDIGVVRYTFEIQCNCPEATPQ